MSLIEQMDRAYMNMRPELKRAIRRHEFRYYDQLTTLATDVERMLETLRVERVPPRPEESLFPEFAYSGKKRPRPFIPHKEKLSREIDSTVSRLFRSVSEIIRKLDDLKSRPERTNEGNPRGNNRTGQNRNYRQNNNSNNSAVPNRGTEALSTMSDPLGEILPHMR